MDSYYVEKIISDLTFIAEHTKDLTQEELENNKSLLDVVLFKLVQISANAERLTPDFIDRYNMLPWRTLKSLRNRIAHYYGSVEMSVIYDTVQNDIPYMLQVLGIITE